MVSAASPSACRVWAVPRVATSEEAERGEAPPELDRARLVAVPDGDERPPALRERPPGRELSLREGPPEVLVEAHHLPRRLHLRPEDHVDPREAGEGEHRLLHRDVAHGPLLEIEVRERFAGHETRRDPGDGNADRLGDEGHGAARPRIDLEHVDLAPAAHRELDVHEPDDPERPGERPLWRRISSTTSLGRVQGGREQAESPEWIPASSMCSMIPAMNTSLPSERASTSISTASFRNRSMRIGAPPATSADSST